MLGAPPGKISATQRQLLGAQDEENLTPMIITTIHPGGECVTGNLLAPLVIDSETRRGAQLTQDDAKYDLRQEIDYLKFGLAVQSNTAENGQTPTGAVEAGSDSREETLVPAGV